MAELQLTRSPDDKKLFELAGIGTMRREGMFNRKYEVRLADGTELVFNESKLGGNREATTVGGETIGKHKGKLTGHGGHVTWNGVEYAFKGSGVWKNAYEVQDGGRTLVHVEGRGFGKKPARVEIDGSADPGLVMFTCWLVQVFTEDDATVGGISAT